MGGKKVHQRQKFCNGRYNSGKFRKMTKCRWVGAKKTKTTRGLRIGACYKLRSAYKSHEYLESYNSYLWTGPKNTRITTWKIVKGKIGRGTISFKASNGKILRHQNYRGRIHAGRSLLFRKDASWYVKGGLAGRGSVSFQSYNFRGHNLAMIQTRSKWSKVNLRRRNNSWKFKKEASWYALKTRC
jgi:hypothetical protein